MKKVFLMVYVILGQVFVSQAQTKHKVGEKYGGGIVFYVESNGRHGLIAAEKDLPGQYAWQEAKDTCKRLLLNGFKDWYLPSKDELNKLYLKRAVVGGFVSDVYWSSSETGDDGAWAQGFYYGTQIVDNPEFGSYVRAVRAF